MAQCCLKDLCDDICNGVPSCLGGNISIKDLEAKCAQSIDVGSSLHHPSPCSDHDSYASIIEPLSGVLDN
ncbi:hypothetical protein ACE6H2_023506 [Prunus campanulata]